MLMGHTQHGFPFVNVYDCRASAHPGPAPPPSLQPRFRPSRTWRLEYAMTWSIVARDSTGAFGVAIASKFFAVGVLCPHARNGVGAVATQALVNPLYGARALELMAQGKAPAEMVSSLIAGDEGREHRQLHMIDAAGRIAAHTGSTCIDWCGQVQGEDYS